MEKGDIVSVVTISGEYVGILESLEDSNVVLKKPRMVIQTERGMGFAHGIAVTGEEAPEEVVFNNVVFVVPTNEGVAKSHTEATTNIKLVK
tara:strand:- start:7908 stop:8180 length:273 start_codon:yes stop_codon:yes gene_type:complete